MEYGFEENADLVGAIKVLRAGHARLVCEVSDAVRHPPKRLKAGSMLRLSGIGISGLQAREDFKKTSYRSDILLRR